METPDGIALVIPARNEELSLPIVLAKVPPLVSRVIVVDNGSTDGTAEAARAGGAEVVYEKRPGYGSACLAGLAFLAESGAPGIVCFADADGSDGVENLPALIVPLLAGEADLALTSRVPLLSRALTPQQRFGNRLATRLIRLFWGHRYRDLGPMRAITWPALLRLRMADRSFGWTVEMQIRAAKERLRVVEKPLPYYVRLAGESKISRTVAGVVRAGSKILWVIGRELVSGLLAEPLTSAERNSFRRGADEFPPRPLWERGRG